METPRPSLELDVDEDKVAEDDDEVGCCDGSSLAFIERFSGASSDEVVDDVLGFPISELTSSAKGLPLTVWLRAFVPLLMVLLLRLLVVVTVTELLVVAGKRSS